MNKLRGEIRREHDELLGSIHPVGDVEVYFAVGLFDNNIRIGIINDYSVPVEPSWTALKRLGDLVLQAKEEIIKKGDFNIPKKEIRL